MDKDKIDERLYVIGRKVNGLKGDICIASISSVLALLKSKDTSLINKFCSGLDNDFLEFRSRLGHWFEQNAPLRWDRKRKVLAFDGARYQMFVDELNQDRDAFIQSDSVSRIFG